MPEPRPRISCSTGSLYHLPLALALRIIRDAGFDGCEFVISPESLARGMAAMGRVVARAGLPTLSVHPPLYPFPGWPRDQRAAILAVVEGAQQLGGAVGVIHAPKSRSLLTPRARQYIAALDEAQALAERAGVVIGLETTQRPRSKQPLLFDDLRYFLAFTDTHDLSVTLDTCHAGANGDDLLVVLDQIGPRLRNIHYSDVRIGDPHNKPATHQFPGTGNRVDLAVFTNALSRGGYGGLITLEIAPTVVGLWPPKRLVRRLTAAREFISRAL